MNILQQFQNGFHAVLTDVEAGVTHIVAVAGDRLTWHRILQTGEVISQDLNIPLLRTILAAIDNAIPTPPQV
jgi:hypothetical protein